MHEIWDERVDRMVKMTDEEYQGYKQSRFAPIDPIWDKAMTWVGLSGTPVLTKLVIHHNPQGSSSTYSGLTEEHYYVLTRTRAFTHRTFTALVGAYAWFVNPTPSMKVALFRDALDHHMVATMYEHVGNDSTSPVQYKADLWWGKAQREFNYNCKEWIDSYDLEKDNDKILRFLDISNVQFVERAKSIRTDGYSNRGGWVTTPSSVFTTTVEEFPF